MLVDAGFLGTHDCILRRQAHGRCRAPRTEPATRIGPTATIGSWHYGYYAVSLEEHTYLLHPKEDLNDPATFL